MSGDSVKVKVLNRMADAQRSLVEAHTFALAKNAMVNSVPAFKRLQEVQKEIGTIMQEINKVQGLD